MVMIMAVGDNRGIIYSWPVTRLTNTLTLRLPFSAAAKRGPLGILFIALHAEIVE